MTKKKEKAEKKIKEELAQSDIETQETQEIPEEESPAEENKKTKKAKKTELVSKFTQVAEFLFAHSIIIVAVCVIFLVFLNYAEYKQAAESFKLSDLQLSKFFGALLFLIIVINLVKYIKTLINKALSRKEHFDEGLKYSILKVTGYVGWVVALWGAAIIIGLKTEQLAILVGALSVGIGFGLQNIVNNFISGLIVLFERPIKKGDWIIIGDKEGIVKSIKIRSTELTAFDGTSILIPNADILSGSLINVTHNDCTGKITIPVSVAYGTDLHKTEDILLSVASAHPEVSQDPAPFVWVTNFGDNGIEMIVKFAIKDVNKRGKIKSEVMMSINDAFNEQGIVIPFPQRDLHIIKENQAEI